MRSGDSEYWENDSNKTKTILQKGLPTLVRNRRLPVRYYTLAVVALTT